MTEYRRAEAGELPEIRDFINMVFSMAHRPHDFRALIPKAYGDDACMPPEHYIARVDGKIEGAVGLLPVNLTVMGERLRCGVVGSVSAHPYAHGAGHMRGCMNAMLEDAQKMGMELMWLGGNRQRYEYFGFSQGGVGMEFTVRDANVKHAFRDADDARIAFASLAPYAAEAEALYDAQIARADRSAGFLQIAGSWTARPFAILRAGAFAGYLIANGDGSDISEIALRDEGDLPAALKAWMRERALSSTRVEVPVWNAARVRTLSKMAQHIDSGAMDMFRMGDFEKNIRLWLSLKATFARLADGRFVLRVEGETPIAIEARGGEVRVYRTDEKPDAEMGRLEAQDLLMAPHRWVDASGLPACVESWFPLAITCFRADGF